MINLLPQKNIKNIKKEFTRRVVIILGLAISVLIFTQIALSSALFLTLNSYIKNSISQVIFTKEFAEKEGLQKSESKVKNINKLLLFFQENENKIEPITDDISEILTASKNNSIKLESFLFNMSPSLATVSIKGNASNRDNLINFINTLKLKNHFQKIESPISNLLKENDVDFSIILELKRQ